MRPVKWTVSTLAVLALLFTGVVGFAHTRPGRPLLGLLARVLPLHARCPLGYDRAATPEQREQARRRFSALHAGSRLARARPALGFALDRTRRDDVLAWARPRRVTCRSQVGGHDLDCEGVDAQAFHDGGPGGALWLDFGADGSLITVTAVRRAAEPAPTATAFEALQRELTAETGAPPQQSGARPGELPAGLLRQATVEARFRNYYALARATNLGDGYVLTEEFHSLPSP